MRLGFIVGYIVLLWGLIIAGAFILLKVIAPIELEAGELATSIFKAAFAISMVVLWIYILVAIKNAYVRRKFVD